MTVSDEIQRGGHDHELDRIAHAVVLRKRTIRHRRIGPAMKSFLKLVREHPGITAGEVARVMGLSGSRAYQIAQTAAAKDHLKIDRETLPQRLSLTPEGEQTLSAV